MSIHAVKWVLEHSPTTGSDRLVLIILAEETRADGGPVFLGPSTIAKRANVKDPRWVKRVLKRLVDQGAIAPERDLHPKYGTRPYKVLTSGLLTPGVDSPLPGSNEPQTSGQSTPEGVVSGPPKPFLVRKDKPLELLSLADITTGFNSEAFAKVKGVDHRALKRALRQCEVEYIDNSSAAVLRAAGIDFPAHYEGGQPAPESVNERAERRLA